MFGKLLSYSNDGDAYNGDYGLIYCCNGDEVCVISYFVLLGFLYLFVFFTQFFGLCTQLDMYKCQQKIV